MESTQSILRLHEVKSCRAGQGARGGPRSSRASVGNMWMGALVKRSGIAATLALLAGCAGPSEPPPPASPRPAGATTAPAEAAPEASAAEAPAIVFLGTSLTAGLGLDPGEAYPALVQERLDQAGLRYRVVNAGV